MPWKKIEQNKRGERAFVEPKDFIVNIDCGGANL